MIDAAPCVTGSRPPYLRARRGTAAAGRRGRARTVTALRVPDPIPEGLSGAVTEPTETPGRPGGLHDAAGQGAHRARRGGPAPRESAADYRFDGAEHDTGGHGDGRYGGGGYDPGPPDYAGPDYADPDRAAASRAASDYGAGSYDSSAYDLDFPPMPPSPYDPDPDPQPATVAADSGAMRIVADAEATARLRIRLPDSNPQPATTLRPHASWEDREQEDAAAPGVPRPRGGGADAAPFAQVAASPARPSALPSELAALTTATLVVPLPRDARPTPALLTTTLPPDNAALANAALLADAFHDTMGEIFGIDFDAVDPVQLGLAPAADGAWYDEGWDQAARPDGAGRGAPDPAGGDWRHSGDGAAPAPARYVPGAVPASTFGGAYGVPTQPASFPALTHAAPALRDPARHALALRYLGGIFHDSSGESSYLDPGGIDPGALAFMQAAEAPTERIAKIPAWPAAAVPASAAPVAAATAVLPTQRPGAASPQRPAPREPHPTRAATRQQPSRPARPAPPRPPAPREAPRRAQARPRRSRSLLVGTLAVAALGLLYGVALLITGGVLGGTVPRGTVVSGIPIGGLSSAAAEQALQSGLGPDRIPLQVVIGREGATLNPATSGVALDPAGTVAAAEAHRTNPLTVIPALFGSTRQIAPVLSVDTPRLTEALTRIAAAYDIPMVEGRITFHGTTPVVTQPGVGRGFSVPDAVSAVRTGYLRLDGPIVIPSEKLTPRATPAALQAALEHLARPAVAAPMTLTTGSASTRLSPERIASVLTIVPDRTGRMVAQVDGSALRSLLPASARAEEEPAVDASFTVGDDEPRLVSGRDGRGFAPAALADAVGGQLTAPAPRTATVPLGDLPPAFTTEDAQALGVTAVLADTTLTVPAAPKRAATVQRAVELVDGSVVQPGETWSFLDTVGPLTADHGFPAIAGSGSSAGQDTSGGVDTVATAVFEAAFDAGMGDAVHHPHAVYASRYPAGLDAAVSAPGDDLRWTDTGGHPVYLYAAYSGGKLIVALLGEKAYDQVKVAVSQPYATVAAKSTPGGGQCTARAPVDGFQVDVTRVLTSGGNQVGSEQYHVTYQPQNGLSCGSTSAGSGSTPGGSAPPSSSPGSGGGSGPSRGPGPGSPPPAPTATPSSGALGGLL